MNTGIKQLPFFPTPYPDECFYSILCRYHVRSGAPTSASTIRRLFGKNYVISSTLHTAFRADYLEQWIPPSKEISSEQIVYEHSSYQYSLLCRIESASRFPFSWQNSSFAEHLDIHYNRLYMYGQSVGKRHGAICYCPACVEEDRRIYGEPYWHLLHQMDGVEFCPVHGEPVLITELGYGRRRMTFFPASETAGIRLSGVPSKAALNSNTADRNAFMRLAEDIAWLLKNGRHLNRNISITQALTQGKNFNDDRYQTKALYLGQLVEKALAETSSAFTKVITDDIDPKNFVHLYMRSTTHALVFAYLMGVLYGSAKKFYESTYVSCSNTRL